MLIDSGEVNINDITRMDIVVGGDHGCGIFRFLMKYYSSRILEIHIKAYNMIYVFYTTTKR